MVRLRIHQLVKVRHFSAYALSEGTNLSYPTARRLSRPGARSAGCTPRPSMSFAAIFTCSPAGSWSGFRSPAEPPRSNPGHSSGILRM